LIAGDTVDTIKLIDTSQCSPEIQKAFAEIKYALERINKNVIQGGAVVQGIMKYTRKGEEGFEPLSLDQILDATLDMVRYKVKLSDIDILRDYPKDHPKILANSVQMQEVFFNFIDNAYDAMVERRTALNEPAYRGKITISTHPNANNGMLEITFQDNGLGIKDDCQNKIFTPFFTTKTSSRQGTGLGLYVIKRIIEEFHKGHMRFESEYGKGTRFTVELPLAKVE
ncbi:MAG: ATP-binding protein, partial [Candidatus Omnitrophica bacterium]|nr:ATP-binding protein [Candidatus Omnitrophota bacterium]